MQISGQICKLEVIIHFSFVKSVSRQAKRTNLPSFNEMKVMEYSYDVSEIEILMNMQISGQICKIFQ